MHFQAARATVGGLVLGLGVLAGCSDDGVADEEAARLAYLGLDAGVERALGLGFDGFNAAKSANIPTQEGKGDKSGTMTVIGQVDQGSSDNKGMRLDVSLAQYEDGPVEEVEITYDTQAPLALDLTMKGLPSAELTGTFNGDVTLAGGLEGPVTLTLTLSGTTEADPADAARIRRVPGGTHIVGTATSDYGTYDVDVTR